MRFNKHISYLNNACKMHVGSKIVLLLYQHGLSLLKHIDILIVYYTYEVLIVQVIITSKLFA